MYEMNVGDGHEWKRLVKCDAFAKCSYAKNVTIFLYVHFDLAYFFRNKDFLVLRFRRSKKQLQMFDNADLINYNFNIVNLIATQHNLR